MSLPEVEATAVAALTRTDIEGVVAVAFSLGSSAGRKASLGMEVEKCVLLERLVLQRFPEQQEPERVMAGLPFLTLVQSPS